MEFLYYVIAYLFGWICHTIYLRYVIKKAIGKFVTNMEQKIEETTIVLKLEKKGDVLYAFDSSNDKFLTQGSSIDEVKVNLKKSYPENSFNATRENMEELGLL